MPTERVWVTPDILLTHNGVTVYFTYQNNDIDHPVSEHLYTVSGSDDSRGRFDVRALDVPSSKLLDMHPPYLSAQRNPAYETATEAQRAEWTRQWYEWTKYGGGHEQAIDAVIREAIDLGVISASSDGAAGGSTTLSTPAPAEAATLCQRITALDEQGLCACDGDMQTLLAQLIEHAKVFHDLATAVRGLQGEDWLEPSCTGSVNLEAAKRSTRQAIAALTGIA